MYNNTIAPIEAVEYYLKKGSLRKSAKKLGIHYQTLYKWVKMYRNIKNSEDKEKLLTGYRKPWNRTKREIEERVVLLKEKEPDLTLTEAKKRLKKEGISLSIKGIWNIWKRYGYAGFKKQKTSNDWTEYCEWTEESKEKYKIAEKLYKEGRIRECAELLNSIPFLPKNEILKEIPMEYLNIRRKIERVVSIFGQEPLDKYLKETEKLYKELKKRGLNYSALRAGICYIIALNWKWEFDRMIKELKELHKIADLKQLFELKWTIFVLEIIANVYLLNIDKAKKIIKKCEEWIRRRKYKPPYFIYQIGFLHSALENYKRAEFYYIKALRRIDKNMRKRVEWELRKISLLKGDLRVYRKRKDMGGWVRKSYYLLFSSITSLIKGNVDRAFFLLKEAISNLEREGLKSHILPFYFTLASIYAAVGERKKAVRLLKKLCSFLKNKKLKWGYSIVQCLISKEYRPEEFLPSIKLVLLLKKGEYYKALSYARKNYLLSYFYRLIFFFPETVLNLIKKGKKTGLPKSILKLPVFNKNVPVYYIKFLGNLLIYRNQKYIRHKLRPKERAFLIHLALKVGEPGKEISVDKIYENFWPSPLKGEENEEVARRKRARNLSHLLLKIKKELKIPSHLIEISYKDNYPVLINKGIYFITDYNEFDQVLTQANAFLRAGEWRFAKREFIRGLNLMRGEPFKKMYDNWSDEMMIMILNRYEKEVLKFINEYLSKLNPGKYKYAKREKERIRRILIKADNIIKYSPDIKEMIKILT